MNIIEWTFELRFIVALALGFLVGLERESSKADDNGMVFGGVRTLPIISMLGFGCAWLQHIGVTLALPIGLVAVAALTSIAYAAKIRSGRFGSTSAVTALLTFVVGALALLVDVWIAMALGIINTILLSEKSELESFVEHLNRVEFLATLKFLLVTLIILPVLPNRAYTRFNLNPTTIWEVVILVSTIGFIGYLLSKKFGNKIGMWLSGMIGGMVSSTAVSVAAGRIAKKDPSRAGSALQASLLACSVMHLRILVLVWIVAPSFVAALWWKLLALAVVGTLLSIGIEHDSQVQSESEVPQFQNPFEIKPAVVFAALFVVLSVVTIMVESTIGTAGILSLAALVGVTDITPFVLSIASGANGIATVVISAIIISVMSNTMIQGAYFGWFAPKIRKETAWRFLLWTALHIPFVVMR
ncbi:MAG: MgtC/SapB family protein, partial [Bacteroidota bacterium]|nr:MgtC/SapB family protein [Bacteroidota bacterium]